MPPLSGAKAPIRRSTKVCCGALGYSKNQEAFSRLARILPYEQLRRTLDSEGQTAAEALLLGRASLLPSQRRLKAAGSSHVLRLEELWARRRSEPLAPELWQLSGLRPNNLPARRLAGFLRLLSRWPSLVAGLSTLEEADRAPVSRLLAAWQAPAESFWRNHHDLSGGSAAPGGALIGRGRALEMLINVVLPFAAAWGGAHSLDGPLTARAGPLPAPAVGRLLRRHALPGIGFPAAFRLRPWPWRRLSSAGAPLSLPAVLRAGECTVCPLSGLHAV